MRGNHDVLSSLGLRLDAFKFSLEKEKKKTRIRQKRSPRPSAICKHIVLLKSRVPGYGRDYKGNTGSDCIHGLGYCTYGAQQ